MQGVRNNVPTFTPKILHCLSFSVEILASPELL